MIQLQLGINDPDNGSSAVLMVSIRNKLFGYKHVDQIAGGCFRAKGYILTILFIQISIAVTWYDKDEFLKDRVDLTEPEHLQTEL